MGIYIATRTGRKHNVSLDLMAQVAVTHSSHGHIYSHQNWKKTTHFSGLCGKEGDLSNSKITLYTLLSRVYQSGVDVEKGGLFSQLSAVPHFGLDIWESGLPIYT
jgi:hypothetical protein